MILVDAKIIADDLVNRLKPYCDRIEIAGSIRREKEFVGDIEIVLITSNYNKLFNTFGRYMLSLNRDFSYNKNGDRYKQFYYQGAKVDLFIVNPDNWGYIFAIRTGSAEFSHNILANTWVKKGFKGDDGYLTRVSDGSIVPVPEETDLFKILGLEWVAPKERK